MGGGRWCELILLSKETLWRQGGPSREIFPFLYPVVQRSFNSTTFLQWQNSEHWLWLSCAGSRQCPALLRTDSSGNSHHQRRQKGVRIQLVGIGPVVWHPTSLPSDYVDGVFHGTILFFFLFCRPEIVKCTYEGKVFYVQVQREDVSWNSKFLFRCSSIDV